MWECFLTCSPLLTAPRNDEITTTRSFSCAPRRIDTATRDEVVTHTQSHFLQASLHRQSRDSPPIPYPNNEPNGDDPPSLTLSAWGFASLRLHPLSLAVVGGDRLRGLCISHSSLEGSGPCGNDSAPRPTISKPTTIVHWSSQHCRSCTHSPDFTHSASEADTLDIQPEVRDLAKRASRYCLDLGDTVHRDVENYATGGSTFVYRGTLDPEGTAIAVKTFCFGHKSDTRVMKVGGVVGCSDAFVMGFSRASVAKCIYGPNSITITFFRYLDSPLNSTIQYRSCPHGWKGGTHTLMCRTWMSIPALWYVSMCCTCLFANPLPARWDRYRSTVFTQL